MLTGTINKENKSKEKRKLSNKIKVTITIVTSIIIILSSLFIYYNNKTYIYNVYSANGDDYFVEGQVSFYKNELSIMINSIEFKNYEFKTKKIKNYEYDISTNNEFIFRYGYNLTTNNLERSITIDEFASDFNMNHTVENTTTRKAILKNNFDVTFRFINENNEEITKKIEIQLKTKETEKE